MSRRRASDAVERDQAVLKRNGFTVTTKAHDVGLRVAAQALEAMEWGHDVLSFGALRRANVRRCGTHYDSVEEWSLTDWTTCVGGEMGEFVQAFGRLASVVKNIRRTQTEREVNGHAIGTAALEAVGDEAADVVIYLDLLCARVGIDLGAAVRRKFNLVSRERLGSDITL